MNSWKVILATIVIFGAGVVTGGLLVNHVKPVVRWRGSAHPTVVEIPVPRGFERGKQFLQDLDAKLRLSPEQKEKIDKIITAGQQRIHSVWQTNCAPPLRAEIQNVNRQIREQLKPEQQKEFEKMLRRPPPRKINSTNAPTVVAPTHSSCIAVKKSCA